MEGYWCPLVLLLCVSNVGCQSDVGWEDFDGRNGVLTADNTTNTPDTSPAPPTAEPTAVPPPLTDVPPSSCTLTALTMSSSASSDCTDDVPSTTTCNITFNTQPCGQSTCINGIWYPAEVNCPCTFGTAQAAVAEVTVHGQGCVDGGVVSHRSSCVYTRSGYSCGSVMCSDGAWVETWFGAVFPVCDAGACAFSALAVPQGAVASDNCLQDNVQSGDMCSFTKWGYVCSDVTCTTGAWSATSPTCTAQACPFDALTVPIVDNVFGNGCVAGGSVTSDAVFGCNFVLTGYECQTALCTEGAWSTTNPSCTPLSCALSDLSKPSDAVPVDCSLSGSAADSETCTFISTNPGHTCTASLCSLGRWSDAIICEPTPCSYDALQTQPGMTFSGTNCVAQGEIRHDSSCSVTLPGHACTDMTCSGGVWTGGSGNTPTCTPNGCAFTTLSATEVNATTITNFTPSGIGCADGLTVVHQGSCSFSATGLTCGHAQCLEGKWSPQVVPCEREAEAASDDSDDSILLYIVIALGVLLCAALAVVAFKQKYKFKSTPKNDDSLSDTEDEADATPPPPMPPTSIPEKELPVGSETEVSKVSSGDVEEVHPPEPPSPEQDVQEEQDVSAEDNTGFVPTVLSVPAGLVSTMRDTPGVNPYTSVMGGAVTDQAGHDARLPPPPLPFVKHDGLGGRMVGSAGVRGRSIGGYAETTRSPARRVGARAMLHNTQITPRHQDDWGGRGGSLSPPGSGNSGMVFC